jgi:hypothetical protein
MAAREKPCPVSVRRGDASYVEVCGEKRRDEKNLGNEEICESGEQTSRRERRRVREKKGVADSNVDGGAPLSSESRGTKVPRMRSRPEAILVKVEEGKQWLQVYREMMVAKEVLKESRGIRRTRAGDILVELKVGSGAKALVEKFNELIGDKVRARPMQDKVSVEIKEIEPLVSREEIVEPLVGELEVKDGGEVGVKTMRRAPWCTQSAIVVLPKVYVDKGGESIRIRTGLTIATLRVLPGVVKCYRCHLFGHTANKCSVVSPDKEICRKCGERDHTIAVCPNMPCCAICSKVTGVRIDHVTGSLACPSYTNMLGRTGQGIMRDRDEAGYCGDFGTELAVAALV